jgi:hypothetical protein
LTPILLALLQACSPVEDPTLWVAKDPAATFSNAIGSEQLAAFWEDPDFDPAEEAFYYARAIEIPTPRWSTYDAMRLGIEAPEPTSLQERAISSAIWYRGE